MALPAWQATIVTDEGDIIPSAVVTVLVEATGLPATLYSNRAGNISLGSVGVFNADTHGFAQFYVAPGEYRVTAEDSGTGFSKTWRYVNLFSTQSSPTDTTPGVLMTPGAFGLGGVSPTIKNLDTLIVGGSYTAYKPDVTAGWPPQFTYAAQIITIKVSYTVSGFLTQTATATRSGEANITVTRTSDGTFTPWALSWNEVNYQPEVSLGFGVARKMYNNTGGTIADGFILAGTSLNVAIVNASGVYVNTGTAASGQWVHVSGATLSAGEFGAFTRKL